MADAIHTLTIPGGRTDPFTLTYAVVNATTASIPANSAAEAIESAINAAFPGDAVRVSGSSGVFAIRYQGLAASGVAVALPSVSQEGSGQAAVTIASTQAGSDPGPSRAIAFRGGASLTCSNVRSSGGDRDAAPFLSDLTELTLLFSLQVREIRSAANGGSPLPIFQIDQDGDLAFAVSLQPDTGTPYDRLRSVAYSRKNGSSTRNQAYFGNMGVHGGPALGEVDPEPGEWVHFAVRMDLNGVYHALAHFRNGQFSSGEGINGAAPQYLGSEDAPLQLTFGAPSKLTPGTPSGLRAVLATPGYSNSDGGDVSVTFHRLMLFGKALTDAEIAAYADPDTPMGSIQGQHLLFCPDAHGSVGAATLGAGGNLVNRGVVALDLPRDGRIMWRDSASALVDVASTAGVSGRGGVFLEAAPGLVTHARIRRAVLNASGTIYVELEDNDGDDVDLASTNTYSVLMDSVAPEISVSIARAAGGVDTWSPRAIWNPPASFGSNQPKGHFLLLPPLDVDPPGEGDSVWLQIAAGWVATAAGAAAGIDTALSVGSILPAAADLIPDGDRLDVGINLSMMDHGFPGMYADRVKHAYRSVEGQHEHLPIDSEGWWILGPGEHGNIAITLPSDQLWDDPYFTQAHQDPPNQVPGRGANPLLGQEGGEFEGLRPSSGTRTIPRKGRLYLKAKAKPGRGGDVALRLGFRNNFDPFHTPNYSTSGENADGDPFPYFASITDGSAVQYHAGSDTYYKYWDYECWYPQGLDPDHKDAIGRYTVPEIRAHFSDAVAKLEAYFVPDEGTEHEAYRFDPFDPPLFDPEFTKGKMQGGGYSLFRFLNASNGNSTGASLASDFAPDGYASLLMGHGRPNPWKSLVPIASVAIPTSAEVAAAAEFDRMARNVYVKITTTVPHGLAHGAKFESQGDLLLGIPRADGEGGATSGVIAYGNAIVLTPTTIMATVAAQKSIGGPVATTGVVSGTPSANFLVRPVFPHLPLEHLARLADECCPTGGGKVWFNVNHAFLQFDPYDRDGDGQVDGEWLQLRLVFGRMVADAPAGVKFVVEPGNEIWNPGNVFYYGGEHFRQVVHRCYGHGAVIRPKTYNGSGGITAWEVVSPGRGYFNGEPRIHSGSGTGFFGLLRTNPLTGAVEGVEVVAPGSGYGTPNTTIEGGDPSVVVSIGKGRGAVLTPVISGGQVTGITITNGGTGYRGGLLRLVGGSGSGATASFTVDGSGVINNVKMHATGSGYSGGDTIHVETPHSLGYGDEPWAGSDQRDAYMANMLLASRMGRLFREVLIENDRDPDDVQAYIGLGPVDWIAPAVQAALAFCNGSGDPMDRLDAAGQHTYWNLTIPSGISTTTMGQLSTEEDMDLFELEAAHVRILDQTLAAGFPEVYVYEGGLDTYNPYDLDVAGEDGDSAGLYRRVLRCMAPHHHHRMHRVELAFLRRMHDDGVSAYCVYEAGNTWRRGGLTGPAYQTSPTLANFYAQWGKYNDGYGEVPGRGDGSDGKHDNRFETNGYGGMFDPGVSVVPEGGAHKDWVMGGPGQGTPTGVAITGPSSATTGTVAGPFQAVLDLPAPEDGQVVSLASSLGGAQFRASSNGAGVTQVVVEEGDSSAQFWVMFSTAGTATLTPSGPGLSSITTRSVAVAAAQIPPSSATLSGPGAATVGAIRGPYTATLDRPAIDSTSVDLYTTLSGELRDSGGSPITWLTFAPGQSTRQFWLLAEEAGSGTIGVGAEGIVGDTLDVVATSPAPSVKPIPIAPPRGGKPKPRVWGAPDRRDSWPEK